MRTADRNRLDTAAPAARPRIHAHITWRDEEPADLDRDLRVAMQASPL